jgi:hypothetical protein
MMNHLNAHLMVWAFSSSESVVAPTFVHSFLDRAAGVYLVTLASAARSLSQLHGGISCYETQL